MKKRVDTLLFSGSVNKDFRINYLFTIKDGDDKFAPAKYSQVYDQAGSPTDVLKIFPSILLNISEGFGKAFILIGTNKYFSFVTLLSKTVDLISAHLYEIFPDADKIEFEGDAKMLEIYRNEKAMTSNGITMYPTIYVDNTNQCYPAIKCTTDKYPMGITIPMEDAIAMNKLFSTFEPITYGLTMMQLTGVLH